MYTHLEAVSPRGSLNEVYVGPNWQVIQTKELRKETVEFSKVCVHAHIHSPHLPLSSEQRKRPYPFPDRLLKKLEPISYKHQSHGEGKNVMTTTYCVHTV